MYLGTLIIQVVHPGRKIRIVPDWTKLGEIPSGDPLKTDKIVKSFRKTEKYRKLPVKSMKACVVLRKNGFGKITRK